ncbi:hypothetical protein P154DRAFT_449491 [Amniculicola lignicola CBS 123094]|uniref:DNA polymerase delta subunit 4 n=1 Tax=Amniculicola lignicola CBS 123094 TaxID=1392246 RepID=A0A6A5VVZ4_9PLEO|nr:hypothetical protein P154DRAFT_449491 [Amniculicola lignicola CBS 123094]
MPPKRRASGQTAKAGQSTLAFHGSANKVTKAGTRVQNAKQNVLEQPATKKDIPTTADVEVEDDNLPTVDSAIADQTEKEVVAQQITSTPEEDEARLVKTTQIKSYWDKKVAERVTPRVHQEELSLQEKILREFDMSAQYGPCTGIARLKRWKRAHRLKLNPPIEVLAVLLTEESAEDKVSSQRSQVDVLLNSRNVSSEVEV